MTGALAVAPGVSREPKAVVIPEEYVELGAPAGVLSASHGFGMNSLPLSRRPPTTLEVPKRHSP
jgi:hypothetical protein